MSESPESILPAMLKVPEVARSLAVGRSTVYKLLNTGALSSVRIGGARRIPAASLVAYLSSRVS